MHELSYDFSIFEKLGLEAEPVGVAYDFFKPEGIEQLDKKLPLCEMLKEAQITDKAFYMEAANESCAGTDTLGMDAASPNWANAGLVGERMSIFKDPAANKRCMTHYKKFVPGSVNYVSFAKLSKLTFDPDLMLFTGPMDKVEPILRAYAYSTGEMYESKSTPVFMCSWLFTYPVVTGKMNYVTMGGSFGMRARQVYPVGTVVVAVPSNLLPIIIDNLKRMPLVIPAWEMGREAWIPAEGEIYAGLIKDAAEAGF